MGEDWIRKGKQEYKHGLFPLLVWRKETSTYGTLTIFQLCARPPAYAIPVTHFLYSLPQTRNEIKKSVLAHSQIIALRLCYDDPSNSCSI